MNRENRRSPTIYDFASTIFISSFLLFQIQPLIGKRILPWFGGTTAMWSSCLLFFQLFLLGGYVYAHVLVSRLRPVHQGAVHLVLVCMALVALLLGFPPESSWKPSGALTWPQLRIILLLSACIGLPYLVISSTAPLMQAWVTKIRPGRSPYRLYALSSAGSLLGLISYPFIVEPLFTLKAQATCWIIGFCAFAVSVAFCAYRAMRTGEDALESTAEADSPDATSRPSLGRILLWVSLAVCGTLMLLATTNQICQDIAVVPFLWVLPLCLYLISFIICFDNAAWYSRVWSIPLLGLTIIPACWVLIMDYKPPILWQIGINAALLFAVCMVCHGELFRLKPSPRCLTSFYLAVSGGGALGGFLVTFIAPLLFNGFWEFQIGLIASCILLIVVLACDRKFSFRVRQRIPLPTDPDTGAVVAVIVPVWLMLLMLIVGTGTITCILYLSAHASLSETIAIDRNYYGVLRVTEYKEPKTNAISRYLFHGRIKHGFQEFSPEWEQQPTSYYTKASGIGVALQHHPRSQASGEEDRQLKVGIVGLGIGVVAAYAEQGDTFRFYEINPQVERLAQAHFTYLNAAEKRGADISVVLGDGRISLEQELKSHGSQQFDILAVDAFSSDAIPTHLLTQECFKIYWRHLKPDGILVIHITNTYVDLRPVVFAAAERHNKTAVLIANDRDQERRADRSSHVLMTANAVFLGEPDVMNRSKTWKHQRRLTWTDDYSNLLRLLYRPGP